MTQPSKKTSGQPAAKLASDSAGKAARNTYAAMESTRSSAENVVKMGSNAMREFMSASAGETQKAQEKMFAMGRESAENFAKSSDTITKAMSEMVGMSRDNIETCVECGNMTAELAKDMTSEMFDAANRVFSDHVEMSKEFFACRTASDMFDLQSRMMRSMIDNFFNQSARMSDMMFEYSAEALEPLNERATQAAKQFSKAMNA
jgi:hypothetical protein